MIFKTCSFYNQHFFRKNVCTAFPHIVSTLEYFSPLNSFRSKNSVNEVKNVNIAATVWICYGNYLAGKNEKKKWLQNSYGSDEQTKNGPFFPNNYC